MAVFDEGSFLPLLDRCRAAGIGFETLRSLGDSEAHRRRLYELNRVCSADIPGRGEFFTYDEYRMARFDREAYDPAGVILALDGDAWVGLAVSSNWAAKGFVFNEMTGVLPTHRRRGIAIAMKLLGIRFALRCGAAKIYTIHDAENRSAIAMNRRLGFVDTDWDRLV